MSVRSVLILLALPLFLLLAAVNSLLLYRQETQDMEAGLRGQAFAAAVTVAEFAKVPPDPFVDLVEPHRLKALHAASTNIPGLDALYLVEAGKTPLSLLDKPVIEPRHGAVPARPEIFGTWRDRQGHPHITAVAPASSTAMVVADIDAAPLVRRAFHLKRLSIALIAGSAGLAILLGLIVARRVTLEFRRTRAMIAAHGGGDAAALGIREVRDLGEAITLIDKSVADELERLTDRPAVDPAAGIAALRAQHFPDVSEAHDGIAIAIRTLPTAPPGSFHAHKPVAGGFSIFLGEAGGEPAEALASAIAARDFIAAGPAEAFEARIALASRAFGFTRQVVGLSLRDGVLALHDARKAMPGYAARNPDLDSKALAGDLGLLLPDAEIVVAVKPA